MKKNINLSGITGDEIVVTGISGIFPNCNSVHDFMEKLFNKVNMVSVDSRWNLTDPELPKHSGRVSGMDKFDYQFFKVGYQQAKVMEPVSKKLMEHAYGAIFDSGNSHATLKGKIGVFIGASHTDFSAFAMFDTSSHSDCIVRGTNKAMMANRISYWLDGKGPSYFIDYSCVSSTAALEHACNSIQSGECDAAVVGASNLCTTPELTLNLKRAGLLCLDGKTKCFNKNGDGCVRSDAVNVIFLQKAKDAKRKSSELQHFLIEVYSKTDIEPEDVEYVEANGAALASADTNEVKAIANVFARNNPIKLGCVKSNMGNSEPASGLCALTKLCLAYHKGQVPANLHTQELQTVQDGKIQILTENTSFDRKYTALNNFSLTGANYHVILKGHYKGKNLAKYNCNIPRIVVASGRQESCVSRILNDLKSKPVDAEEVTLLHNIFERDILGHTGRGYTILESTKEKTEAVSEGIDHYQGVKPPLWFVFSGMGSQWASMGADLMRIPTFAAAIKRCHKVLQPKGLDLLKVITEPDDRIFDNILHAFIGIGAMQIGLTDILNELGIVPDFIIGHSLGEAACAYQDGTMTAEEMIISVYCRGRVIQEAALIKGTMAAVGVGYKNLVNQCPPEVDIACHNSFESSTISGPVDIMETFVGDLTKRGIFARVVPSANVAYHSRYIAGVGPNLLKCLNEIIKSPKLRSDKWISTSVPRQQWDTPVAKYSSAEYHTNNLLNPVLFEEVLGLIPDNAVVVEIAPHGLLQAILKRSLKNCMHIPLTNRGTKDGVKFVLEAIGKLYIAGFNPKVEVLYPKVVYPVSTETPLLSHLVEWEHSESWPIFLNNKKNRTIISSSRNIVLSIHDEEYKYLEGYFRNGVNILPEAAILVFVWETLAMYQETDFRNLSVHFRDIHFHSEIIITAEAPIRFTVMISKGSNNFEVTQGDDLILSGMVHEAKVLRLQENISDTHVECDEFEADIKLSAQDTYRVLKLRGFDCRGEFQSIMSSNIDCTKALIKWTEHWIPFVDSLIQFGIISRDIKGISKPKFISNLIISIPVHVKDYEVVNDLKCYDANINNTCGILRCGGVQIKDITYTDAPLIENTAGILKSQNFFPFYSTKEVDINTAVEVNMQIIAENSKSKEILITKVVNDKTSKEFNSIDQVLDKFIWVNTKIRSFSFENDDFVKLETNEENLTNVIIIENLLQESKIVESFQNISKDTFIISFEDKVPKTQSLRGFFTILSSMSDGAKILVLMKRLNGNYKKNTVYIPIKFDDTFSWVSGLYSKIATTERVILISERQPYCGALGLVKKLKMNGHRNVSLLVIDDFSEPRFDPENNLYKEQLQKNMTINIIRKGQWGSFYYRSVKKTQKHKSFALKNLEPGNFENLSWVEAPRISGEKTLAQVSYSGLSINDCNNIVNDDSLRDISLLGMDFSGIDNNGDRVMGLIAEGSAASAIETDPDLLWPVPDEWTLEDAATVPLAYVQAYYSLTMRSNLQRGKRVMICDATGSIGQAMITLCLSYECIIFGVVDSEEKVKTLLKLYPQLPEKNIICSGDDSFYNFLMMDTKGTGCDFVINFAAGACREAAAKCVGKFGVFLDFSQHDMLRNETIGMSFLNKDRSYMAIVVSNIFRPEYSRDRMILQRLIAQGIKHGVVKPLSRVVFSSLQASKVFSILSLNKHTGKVLIRVKDPNISNGLDVIPRLIYSAQDVIVIICDEKGIGLELPDKFIERGARKIVLHMKKNSVTGYFQTKLLSWNKQKVSVKLYSDNLQNDKKSETFIKDAMKFGKVKCILMVFDPQPTDNGTKEDFVNAFKKQSLVMMNLDVASRNYADPSHFIALSRSSQCSSDEYALSLIEKVCNVRNELGFPTLFVRYDSIYKLDESQSNMNKTKPLSLSAIFNAIETSLKQKFTNVITFDLKKEAKIEPVNKDGMNILFNHVDAEEDNVTAKTIVELPTLFNSSINAGWDPEDSYLILLPGFEGRPQIFESAAERLKMRAACIQFGADLQGKSVEEVAYYARQELKKSLGEEFPDRNLEKKKFFIMGYSFGVNIALELAFLLEKEGKTGVVHCIDSSPDALRVTLDAAIGKISDNKLQDHVLNHMYNLLTRKKGKLLQTDLKNMTTLATFNAKVDECLKKMKDVSAYSMQYKKLVLESAYNKIVMAQKYEPQFKLRSQLVLMKNSKNLMTTELPNDYNLSRYSIQPVKVYALHAADIAKTPYDCRISNIVNMFVDRKTNDEFK